MMEHPRLLFYGNTILIVSMALYRWATGRVPYKVMAVLLVVQLFIETVGAFIVMKTEDEPALPDEDF